MSERAVSRDAQRVDVVEECTRTSDQTPGKVVRFKGRSRVAPAIVLESPRWRRFTELCIEEWRRQLVAGCTE